MGPKRGAVGVKRGGAKGLNRGQLPNVLSIVIELNLGVVLPGAGTKLAVVGETNKRMGEP